MKRVPEGNTRRYMWKTSQPAFGWNIGISVHINILIARFMGQTWGPSGADRTQVGPMFIPWTLLSGYLFDISFYYSNIIRMSWLLTCQRFDWLSDSLFCRHMKKLHFLTEFGSIEMQNINRHTLVKGPLGNLFTLWRNILAHLTADVNIKCVKNKLNGIKYPTSVSWDVFLECNYFTWNLMKPPMCTNVQKRLWKSS